MDYKETKRNIDSARDILVGVVTNPISQVEQISIALIYKFMDDMDKESVSLGGKASFFTGKFKQYSWTKIFDPKIGGIEMLRLYSEAIEQLNQNPNIPSLFRDIFKNAYLPYRNPETLKLFLKTINEFSYDNSEVLGDAFEHLLSILGSQGDAGQFRTPRHIIDFIVDVLDPKKNETILDPACGTAGFLISAYKHILKNTAKGKLSPDERRKLIKNIAGYELDPTMKRFSLVNMYLHGFTTPSIFEYDTLSNEDKWNETYDVILANPPFMSPKGGIRPHKKFSIQANRSEVLFVDYIAEHIDPVKGRAGIIVPEGIIFQSGTAYKALRKMLVDKNYLYAVVSLPAGIFNPYSGVKTSILLMDKAIAKKTDNILFIKIDNDGFDLGAQRRAIDKNDLTASIPLLKQYRENLLEYQTTPLSFGEGLGERSMLVPKKKIAAGEDYNLSIERYRVDETVQKSNFEMTPLIEISDLIRGITFGKKEQLENETLNSLRVATTKAAQENGIVEKDLYYVPKKFLKDDEKLLRDGDILISTANSLNLLGRTTFIAGLKYQCSFGAFMSLVRPKKELVLPLFLLHCLKNDKAKMYFEANANTTTNISNLSFNTLENFEIPLPPIPIQQQIVEKIESYQKIIDGAKQVTENYKPQIEIDESWESVELGNICENYDSKRKPVTKSSRSSGKYPYYGASGIVDYVEDYLFDGEYLLVSEDGANLLARVTPIAFSITGRNWVNNHAHILKFKNKSTQSFIELFLNSISLKTFITGSAQPKLNQSALSSIPVPLPPLSVQQEIVKRIENEQQLVNANKQLIELFNQKIKDEINKLWQKTPEKNAGKKKKSLEKSPV